MIEQARPFAAFDVDGTVFKSSLLEKIVDQCVEQNIFPAEPFNEVYASKRRWRHQNSEGRYMAYIDRLIGTFVQHMEGVEAEHFAQATQSMVEQHQVRQYAFPRRLMQHLESTHRIIAISGSPRLLVEPFLAQLPVHDIYGSTFTQRGGVFTGNAEAVGDKAAILARAQEDGRVVKQGSVAIGDTVSDIPMLRLADMPIMFNASATLTDYGREFCWPRVNEEKDQITALQYDKQVENYVEISPEQVLARVRNAIQAG